MAATTLRGTQQIDSVPGPLHDGKSGAWHGKGPAVDRAGDGLKHANLAGVRLNDGVVAACTMTTEESRRCRVQRHVAECRTR